MSISRWGYTAAVAQNGAFTLPEATLFHPRSPASSQCYMSPHEGEPCGQSFPTGRKPSGAWGLGMVLVPALRCSVAALLGGHSHEQGDAGQPGHDSICLLPVGFCIKNLFLKLYFSSRIFFFFLMGLRVCCQSKMKSLILPFWGKQLGCMGKSLFSRGAGGSGWC